jgi:phytoene desaturase
LRDCSIKNQSVKALIIGSGIAGLATSVRLASRGYEVEVFESNEYPGGKLTEITLGDYRFDAGPSLFTMPQLVDELFTVAGKASDDYFAYYKKDISCHYFWEDGTRFQAPASMDDFSAKAAETFTADESRIRSYLNETHRLYHLTKDTFLTQSLHKIETYLRKETLRTMAQAATMPMLSTLHRQNEKRLRHPKLVQLFDRFATYNGSNPYQTPGIMMLSPFLEFGIGTFFPKGGMHSITTSIFQLAKDLGVRFHFNTRAERIDIKNNKAVGIETTSGYFQGDVVVSNMDIYPTYKKLLPSIKEPKKILAQERSSSALIFYWGMAEPFPELELHNIFFSDNYQAEFDNIFNKRQPGEDPTVYINITSKENPSDAPPDSENWFVMVNVPGNKGQDWETIINHTRQRIINKLERILGRKIEHLIEEESILDPRLIESKTSSYQGALYGSSSNSRLAAFLRHPNFKRDINNLYFCGGSVHPGGGIPLCLLSAKIVGDLVPDPEAVNIATPT